MSHLRFLGLLLLALGLLIAAPAAGQTVMRCGNVSLTLAVGLPAVQNAKLKARADSLLCIRTQNTPSTGIRNRTALYLDSLSRGLPLPAPVPVPVPPPDTSAARTQISPRSGQGGPVGSTLQFGAVTTDASGDAHPYAVTWSSSSSGIATVSATGLVRAVAPGRAWIRATVNVKPSVRDSVPYDVAAPPPTDTVVPPPSGWSRVVKDTAFTGDLVVPAGQRWLLQGRVQVGGNVLVQDAALGCRGGANTRLVLVGRDPSTFVGGGMEYSAAVAGDVGVWVWGSGQLDFSGTLKLGWNRTGTDLSWLPTDEYWIAPTRLGRAPEDYAATRWAPGQAVPLVDPRARAAEVINVTRDCAIEAAGAAHVHIHSSMPQRIENVQLRGLGVTNPTTGEYVLGRYALHFHVMRDASRFSSVRGLAFIDSKGIVFVPHSSSGITAVDVVSVNSYGPFVWWDEAQTTVDFTCDRCGFAGVRNPLGPARSIVGFELGAGANMEIRNSFASGVFTGSGPGVGFNWPEPTPNYDPVQDSLVWRFDVGNVSHTNRIGLRFWNNSDENHTVRDYLSYRDQVGIENGAYLNANRYQNTLVLQSGYLFSNDYSACCRAVNWNGNGATSEDGLPAESANCRYEALEGPALMIGHRQVPANTYTRFVDCAFVAGPGKPKVLIQSAIPETSPARLHFIRSGVLPDDIVWESYAGNNEGSEVLIDHEDGRRWRILITNGQKVVQALAAAPSGEVAELPRVRVNTAYTAPLTAVRVPAGGNLQAAINAGGLVLLSPGVTYAGNFTLPAKMGSAWTVLATDVPLPPEGTRVGPGSLNFARIVTPNADPAIATVGSASRYRIMGVEVTAAGTVTSLGALVSIGSGGETDPARQPRDIIIDRAYVHGHDSLDLRRCVDLEGAASAVIDSYLSECHSKGSDSQAILTYNTPGPLKISNNYLEGAGENFMAGGADAKNAQMIPADIEFVGNLVVKPAAWFQSQRWSVKNLFEIKAGTRVLVEGNTFDGNWVDGQTGHAFMLFSVNQDGSAPWTYASDITIRKNVIRNSSAGFTLAEGYGTVAAQLARVVVEDNRFESMGSASPYAAPGDARYLFGLVGNVRDIRVRHNSYASAGLSNQVVFEGTVPGLVFENNVVGPAEYGFQNAGELATMAPGGVVRGNVLAPATFNDQLPPGNCIVWPPSAATSCASAGIRP